MSGFLSKILKRLWSAGARGRQDRPSPRPVAIVIPPAAATPRARYFIATARRLGEARAAVYHGASGRIAAVVDSAEKAATLCDTLNLACGVPPSRKLLGVLHHGVDERARKDGHPV